MSSLSVQRLGPLSVLAFPASSLGLYVQSVSGSTVYPTGPDEILGLSGAIAALDGPMFGVCSGQNIPNGNAAYAVSQCDQIDYLHLDAPHGLSVPTQYPSHGITISVVDGSAVASQGSQVAPGASVAIQLYPPLVWQGQNVASQSVDTDVVWRAGLAVLADGQLAFAVMQSSMYDFADALANNGAIYAGYTDGGGSGKIVTPDGFVGNPEPRRVASWLIVRPPGSPWLLPSTLLVAGAAAVAVYFLQHKSR